MGLNKEGFLILLEFYFAFQYVAVFDPAAGFQARRLLVVTDGRMVVDGGWWMVDGGGWWWWMVEKNVLRFCSKFFQMKLTAYKCAVFWKICEKLFFTGKKSDSKFENRGYFVVKKVPLIFWFFF